MPACSQTECMNRMQCAFKANVRGWLTRAVPGWVHQHTLMTSYQLVARVAALRSGDGGQPPQRSALLSSMPACLRALRRRRPPARRCSTTCRRAAWRRTWSPAAASSPRWSAAGSGSWRRRAPAPRPASPAARQSPRPRLVHLGHQGPLLTAGSPSWRSLRYAGQRLLKQRGTTPSSLIPA